MEDLLEEMVQEYLNDYKGWTGGMDLPSLTATIRGKLADFEAGWREKFPEPADNGGKAQWQTSRAMAMQEYLQALLPLD